MLKDTISCCTVFLHGNSPCDIFFSRQHQHNTHAIARVLILHKTFQNSSRTNFNSGLVLTTTIPWHDIKKSCWDYHSLQTNVLRAWQETFSNYFCLTNRNSNLQTTLNPLFSESQTTALSACELYCRIHYLKTSERLNQLQN